MQETTEYKQLHLFQMPRHQLPAPFQQDGLFGVAVTVISDDGIATTYEPDGTISIAKRESEPCPR
mgnify:CR=1 FL=1